MQGTRSQLNKLITMSDRLKRIRFKRIGMATLGTALSAALMTRSVDASVWLSGDDPIVQVQKHKQTPGDYLSLFAPDSPWATAAGEIAAFKISQQFALRAPDDQLRTIIADLKRQHIALAIELGVLVGSPRCGMGVEGYATPAAVETVAIHIQKAGG